LIRHNAQSLQTRIFPGLPVCRAPITNVIKGVTVKPDGQAGHPHYQHYGNRHYDCHHDDEYDNTQFEIQFHPKHSFWLNLFLSIAHSSLVNALQSLFRLSQTASISQVTSSASVFIVFSAFLMAARERGCIVRVNVLSSFFLH
jgi:hypothetical protein